MLASAKENLGEADASIIKYKNMIKSLQTIKK